MTAAKSFLAVDTIAQPRSIGVQGFTVFDHFIIFNLGLKGVVLALLRWALA